MHQETRSRRNRTREYAENPRGVPSNWYICALCWGSGGWMEEDDVVVNAESGAAEIVLDHVTKRYGNSPRPAIDDLSLTIPAGEICVLIGPSGGGKTTAMKMINRLISISEGDITIDGTSVRSLEVTELRRGIGYVIQQIGLFPHMTVENNIGTVPRLLGWDKARIRARSHELLELVGLDPDEHAKRYPSQLSGGQRQRVGLARAMAADPPLMLMDEPFGAIDPITRERLQNDFLRLHRELRKTVVFVTHDIDEAIKMGDRICILRQGGVFAQYDTPEAILAAPADEFVAQFVGADRGLKRLALRRLDEVSLMPVPDGADGSPETSSTTTLRDALSLMLTEGSSGVVVRGEDGDVKGYMTFDVVSRLLSESEGQRVT
jgi:osmoprotectant transport system ATP-binding protein